MCALPLCATPLHTTMCLCMIFHFVPHNYIPLCAYVSHAILCHTTKYHSVRLCAMSLCAYVCPTTFCHATTCLLCHFVQRHYIPLYDCTGPKPGGKGGGLPPFLGDKNILLVPLFWKLIKLKLLYFKLFCSSKTVNFIPISLNCLLYS